MHSVGGRRSPTTRVFFPTIFLLAHGSAVPVVPSSVDRMTSAQVSGR